MSILRIQGFAGTDTFEYQIVDSDGNVDTAMMTITITQDGNGPLNDPPIWWHGRWNHDG